MIEHKNGVFFLQTKNSSYVFRISPQGLAEHLTYGAKISEENPTDALVRTAVFPPGNTIALSAEEGGVSEEELLLEVSTRGKGDVREPLLEVIFADGSRTTDFRFADFEIRSGKTHPEGLPSSYGDSDCSELRVRFRDRMREGVYSGIELILVYDVFEDCDVIVRRSILKNKSDKDVRISRILSFQLDLEDTDYKFHTFGGPWIREMEHFVHPISHGKVINGSVCGYSSNRNNPFTFLARPETTEEFGECFGFNLVYSGNHYTCCDTNSLGSMRVVGGIHPEGFEYRLSPKETFESPEAVMTFSSEGFRGMSRHLHNFVRKHIVRGKWQFADRPVLLNSWEVSYFKIKESKLLKIAKNAKEVGIELFVMDDGWFRGRNGDDSSLGDWTADPKKLPHGLKGLSEKIREMGLMFGLWVEPEMVNRNSDLYRAHPDWAVQIPGREHSEGRNQMILDLSRDDVCDYLIEAMSHVFEEGQVSYVKWDLNRIFSDVYSNSLPPERQGEMLHRYMLGLYRVLNTLTRKFPEILFEGCASGGCRFDLGILCFMPQIWASDDTDPYVRAEIQTNLSFGYPQSVVSAHVSSSPNHQTLRETPLHTRFSVAAFGSLGYECDLSDLTRHEKEEVIDQIRFYKWNRKVFLYGQFYRIPVRGREAAKSGQYQWMVVDESKEQAVGFYLQGSVQPNVRGGVLRGAGLSEEMVYEVSNYRCKYDVQKFGSLINTAAPIYLRQKSQVYQVLSRMIRMEDEHENCVVQGNLLMYHGVRLKHSYTATGFNEDVRMFQDYDARLYKVRKISGL